MKIKKGDLLLQYKRLIITFLILICVVAGIFFLRANPEYDLGGYEIKQSPSLSWSTNESPQADFSNDDTWNQSYIWAHESSARLCKGDLAESDPYQLNGSSYAAVGSTMATNPQLLVSCLVPVPQKSLVLMIFNFLLVGLGMFLVIQLLFPKAPGWLGIALTMTGPMMIYGVWPHSASFAWVPLGIYTTSSLLYKPLSFRRIGVAGIIQVCILLSGQPEATFLGFLIIYLMLIAILISQRCPFVTSLKKVMSNCAITFLSVGIAAFALIPIAIHALSSTAATSRTNISFIPWSAQKSILKDHAREGIFQFLDPGLFSSANPYRTLLSIPPYSRLSAWVGMLMLCLIIVVLLSVTHRKIIRDSGVENKNQNLKDREVLSIVRAMSLFGLCSFLLSLRIPWLEYLCSKIPIIASSDRNLFRYMTVFFIFLAAIGSLHLITKKIVVLCLCLFAATRLLVIGYIFLKSSNLELETKVRREDLQIPYSTIVTQRWLVVGFSLLICGICLFAISKSSLKIIRVLVALAICFEISQIIIIHPQNWSKSRPSQSAIEVRDEINRSGERLLVPKTFFATAGTWLHVPTMAGYSIISEEEKKIVDSLKSCVINNDFFFMTCGYDKRDAQVYDASNVGWVISLTKLENDNRFYGGDLHKVRELSGEFSLYRRESQQSDAFNIDSAYCRGGKEIDNIKDVEIQPINSELIYEKDPDKLKAKIKEDASCILLSLTYDEAYEINASGTTLKPKSIGGFLVVDVSEKKVSEISLEYISPGRSLGKIISVITLLVIALIIMTWFFFLRNRTGKIEVNDVIKNS